MATVIDHGDGRLEVITASGATTIQPTSAGPLRRPSLSELTPDFDTLVGEQIWLAAAVYWFVRTSYRCTLQAVEVLDVDDDGREETRLLPRRDPISRFVHEPWRGAGPGDLPAHLIGSLQVQGNGAVELESGPAETLRARPHRWSGLRYKPVPKQPWLVEGWIAGGRPVTESHMVHVAWWAPSGAIGISPLQQLDWTVRSERAAQEWMLTNLVNGARPDGVVELGDNLLEKGPAEKQAALDLVSASLRGAFGGPGNAGKLPVIPPGMTWKDTRRTTAVEAALIDQRVLTRDESAGIYGLSPVALGVVGDSSEAFEEINRLSASGALGPLLHLIEQRATARVRELTGRPSIALRFDMTALMRGDFLKEVEAGQKATGVSTHTPQEFRDRMGLRRLDRKGIDDLWVNRKSNVAPMGDDVPDDDSET